MTFNSFPQPKPDAVGGRPSILDWSKYTTVYDWTGTTISVPASSYGAFLDITGEGYLMFARGDSDGSVNPDIRITVDGVSYIFTGINSGSINQGNVLLHPIYYKTSLKIEVFNRSATAQNMRCDYTYLSKTGTPSNNQTLLTTSSRLMGYGTNATSTDTNVVNVVGSGYLLAIEFSGFQNTANNFVVGTVTVDSVIKMNSRNVFQTAGEDIKHHVFQGPIRFTTNLKVQHKASSPTVTALTRVWYTLD